MASARPRRRNQTALAPSLAQSLNLFGNQLLEVKIKGGTPARCSGESNPRLNSDLSPFFTLSTAKKEKKEKKKLVLFLHVLDYENIDFTAFLPKENTGLEGSLLL